MRRSHDSLSKPSYALSALSAMRCIAHTMFVHIAATIRGKEVMEVESV